MVQVKNLKNADRGAMPIFFCWSVQESVKNCFWWSRERTPHYPVTRTLISRQNRDFLNLSCLYLSIPSFSSLWLTGVLFLTFDIDRSTSSMLYQHPRTSRIEDWLLPFKQSIYLIFTLIGRYQQFIINIRELNVLNNDYLLCSFLFTSQSSHLESWSSHFSLPKVLILNL
jgi:hypothetical protein